MTVATEVLAVQVFNVSAGTPIPVAYPLYRSDEVFVYYGKDALLAVLNTDYMVTLGAAPDFYTFVLTPTASLIAKINALIALDGTEVNFITIRRELPMTTASTPPSVANTTYTSREFDRITMKLQQLAEKILRSILLPPTFVGEESITYNPGGVDQLATYDVNGNLTPLASPLASELASLGGVQAGRALVYPASPAPAVYDAVNRRIANVADPVNLQDAMTRAYLRASGALQILFTRTGWPGGVARTLFSWLLEKQISVKDYGAVGDGVADDTIPFQRAFADAKANGNAIFVPTGRYKITSSLIYDRSADGNNSQGLRMFGAGVHLATLINAIAAGGPLIDMTAGATAVYMQGGIIAELSFEQSGSGANSHGIRYRSCWHQTFQNLRFFQMNGSALKSINTAQDADASAHVDFLQIRAHFCQGPGIDNDNGSGGLALHRLVNCEIGDCGLNGTANMILDGNIQFSADMCSFANVSTNFPLVLIKSTNVRTRQLRFSGGEYGNNSGTHFKINAVSSLHVNGIRHVRRVAENNSTIGFDFPDGASLYSGIKIENVELQIDDNTPVWTWIKMGTGLDSAGSFDVKAPNVSNFAAGNKLYDYTSNAAKQKQLQLTDEAGREILSAPMKQQLVTLGTGPGLTLTPDFSLGGWIKASCVSGSSAYVVAAPIGGETNGRRVMITLLKDSTMTVSWHSIFEAPTMPTTGGTWEFIFDAPGGAWRLIL